MQFSSNYYIINERILEHLVFSISWFLRFLFSFRDGSFHVSCILFFLLKLLLFYLPYTIFILYLLYISDYLLQRKREEALHSIYDISNQRRQLFPASEYE